jgi:beta-galactosidase
LFLRAYEPTTGKPVGWYDDGRIAAVDNQFGRGKTRLIGTMPGSGYSHHPGIESSAFFMDLMDLAGKEQHIKCSDHRVKARLHHGDGGTYLWVANPKRQPIPVRLELGDAWGPFSSANTLWGSEASVDRRNITLTAGARDVAVMELS